MKHVALTLYCLLFCIQLASAESFECKVIGVSDGDTITVIDANKNEFKIRLSEIDTPEKSQAFGAQAKKALADKVFGQVITIVFDKRDRYGRIIGTIYLGKRWINKEMVEEGYAWHYKQYASSEELAAAEQKAREKKLALWLDKNVTAPWEFRSAKRKKTAGRRYRTLSEYAEETAQEPDAYDYVVDKTTLTNAARTKEDGVRVSRSWLRKASSEGHVWVNTGSGIYHPSSSRWYGNTKQGSFMTRDQANSAGYRETKRH